MIHFFGDSFTYCQGCNPGEEYYDRTYDGTQKTWVELISEHIGYEFLNNASPGIGNQKIIDSVIHHLHTINDGDIVFLSRTNDMRFSVPHKDGYFEDVLIGMLIDRTLQFQEWSDSYYNAVNSYVKEVLINGEKSIIHRFDTLFDSLSKSFESRNIKCIRWDVDEHLLNQEGFPKYSIISDVCDIKDGHWSWKGHQQFFEFIKNEL